MRDAASAVIGRTVTANAAAMGLTAQPATSSRTSRNSTAVSAAATSPSAADGANGIGPPAGAGTRSSCARSAR